MLIVYSQRSTIVSFGTRLLFFEKGSYFSRRASIFLRRAFIFDSHCGNMVGWIVQVVPAGCAR